MRRFLVAASMGTMVLLGPAAPALAEPATAAQPQTQTVAVADQNVQKSNPGPTDTNRGGGGKAGLWGLLGLLGLLGFAGMRKPKAKSHHHDVGVSERPSAPGR